MPREVNDEVLNKVYSSRKLGPDGYLVRAHMERKLPPAFVSAPASSAIIIGLAEKAADALKTTSGNLDAAMECTTAFFEAGEAIGEKVVMAQHNGD
jgi:hypothetical protein